MPNAEPVVPAQEVSLSKASKRVGVRQISKQESQHRIMMAARDLFAELGYEQATLRQIAEKAGLTVGALFNHVTDKRDLIYLIFNEEVETVAELALAAPRPYQTFDGKLRSIVEHYYRLFAGEPVLARILLSEVVVLTPGMHLKRYLLQRNRLVGSIAELVEQAQQTGEIKSTETPEVISRCLFFLLASSIRWWLASSSKPEWRAGVNEFERLLALQMSGLSNIPLVTR